MALWAAESGRLWAKLIDPDTEALASPPTDLGQLATGSGPSEQQPLPIPLRDGDLALLGLLQDGRVTFTRGSALEERRVAPTVIIPAATGAVLELAAAEGDTGLQLLLLRGPDGYDPITRQPPQHVRIELYSLGPSGRTSGEPLRWTTESGFRPALVQCAGTRFVAWQSANNLVVTRVASDGTRSSEQTLAGWRTLSSPGPAFCQGESAKLTTTWTRDPFAADNLPALSSVALPPQPAKLAWSTVKLPGAPEALLVKGERLSGALHRGALYVQVAGKVPRLVRVDLRTNKPHALPLPLPTHQHQCIALALGTRAVCATSERTNPSSACANEPARVRVSFIGTAASPAARPATEFWKHAAIDRPEAPGASEQARRRTRLRCGEPGWEDVSRALETWCTADAAQGGEGKQAVYCSRDAEYSLLYQSTRCTNLPASCPSSKFALAPSVDRAEFEKGERIELSYMNCSVYLERSEGRLRVIDSECTGQ